MSPHWSTSVSCPVLKLNPDSRISMAEPAFVFGTAKPPVKHDVHWQSFQEGPDPRSCPAQDGKPVVSSKPHADKKKSKRHGPGKKKGPSNAGCAIPMAAPLPDLPANSPFSHRSVISVGECGDDSGDEYSSQAVGSAAGVSRATGGRCVCYPDPPRCFGRGGIPPPPGRSSSIFRATPSSPLLFTAASCHAG